MDVSEVGLRGAHNIDNATAAAAATLARYRRGGGAAGAARVPRSSAPSRRGGGGRRRPLRERLEGDKRVGRGRLAAHSTAGVTSFSAAARRVPPSARSRRSWRSSCRAAYLIGEAAEALQSDLSGASVELHLSGDLSARFRRRRKMRVRARSCCSRRRARASISTELRGTRRSLPGTRRGLAETGRGECDETRSQSEHDLRAPDAAHRDARPIAFGAVMVYSASSGTTLLLRGR